MRLNIAVLMAFAAVTNAAAIPASLNQTNGNETHSWSTPLDPRRIYDCKGSIMCPTLKVQWCDEGVNSKLIRNDEPNYGAAGSGRPHVGVCHGKHTDWGCAILIQGNRGCVRSGNDMWWDYQEIRKSGCHHCGHKYWRDGCSTTIDYYPECDFVK
ncbi:hypothetical protein F5Y06DRAFT_287492 [Hypoxylon sp. FL0890]|nr:hypothetical protein F5Y06DRAFT_287492 [Hypoxylon sp. FL0890]